MADKQPIKVLHVSTQTGWRGGEQQIMYLVRLGKEVRHYLFCPEEAALRKEAKKEENRIEKRNKQTFLKPFLLKWLFLLLLLLLIG